MRPAVAPAMGATCATSTSYGGRRSGAFANHPSRVRRPTRTGRRLRTAHRASPRDDVLEVTTPIPWSDRCNLDDGAHPTTQRGDETFRSGESSRIFPPRDRARKLDLRRDSTAGTPGTCERV